MFYVFQNNVVSLQTNIIQMAKQDIKKGRGGARPGAGRPRKQEESKLYSFRASGGIAKYLDAQEQKTEFIKNCIAQKIMDSEPDFSQIGDAYPATMVKDLNIPFFDIGIAAGFPIPLDNDERAQSIELLQMLCPYPESSYLIRVDGDSMIDANIYSGDIVIVDKSQRNPSPSQVAVCQLNGDYTLKCFEVRNGVGWLIPANPDYPEIKVTEDDSFYIWGTVTYVIHKPNNR
jgi:DNA polymerase V